MPAVQGVHDDCPSTLKVPAAQERHAAEDVLPANGLYVPAEQKVHEGWAVDGLYEPGKQTEHAAEDVPPADGLYVPAGQGVQDDCPPTLKVPAAQARHAAEDAPPADGLCVPAAQKRHAV